VKLGVVAGLVAVLLSSLIYIFSAGLVGLFTKDSNVIAIGKSYLVVVSPFYIMFYMLQIFIGLIRGLGDTLRPMYISWFNTFGVRIPVAFFSGFRVRLNNFKIIPHNYKGIWYGEPVAWTLGLALTVYIFLSRFRGKLQKCTLNS
jgi:Na+-driven multidrug efflux pump